jgi:hypothetical protein
VDRRSGVSPARRGPFAALAVAAAAAVSLVASSADPPELPRVRAYVSSYQQAFAAVIADETTTQVVRRRSQAVRTQTSRGEFFITVAGPDGPWMSVHDVTEVDGKPVDDRVDLPSLLAARSVRDVGPDLARANARFNIGSILRNFNEPTLALQLWSPRMAGDVTFSVGRRGATSGGHAITISAKLAAGATFVQSAARRRVTTRATFVCEPDTGRIRETSLWIDDGEVEARLETTYARDDHVALWVPAVFIETYTRRDESTLVTSRFSNYRRFETKGRLLR